MQRIRFKGVEYLLVGDSDEGAICTPEQYRTGELGFAHLCSDGNIRSYRRIIGTIDDIEFLGEASDPIADLSLEQTVRLLIENQVALIFEAKEHQK